MSDIPAAVDPTGRKQNMDERTRELGGSGADVERTDASELLSRPLSDISFKDLPISDTLAKLVAEAQSCEAESIDEAVVIARRAVAMQSSDSNAPIMVRLKTLHLLAEFLTIQQHPGVIAIWRDILKWNRQLYGVGARLSADYDAIPAHVDVPNSYAYERNIIDLSKLCTKYFGPSHSYALEAAQAQAIARCDLGDDISAMQQMERTFADMQQYVAEEHPLREIAARNMAILYALSGAHSKAEPILCGLVEKQARELGADDPVTTSTMNLRSAIRMQTSTE